MVDQMAKAVDICPLYHRLAAIGGIKLPIDQYSKLIHLTMPAVCPDRYLSSLTTQFHFTLCKIISDTNPFRNKRKLTLLTERNQKRGSKNDQIIP